MNTDRPLLAELDRWQDAGRIATFWLRDDDAADLSLPLERLLTCTLLSAVPSVLAVVPMAATEALANRLRDRPDIAVWQHGVDHANNATVGAKNQELIDGSDRQVQMLAAAGAWLRGLFGRQAQPVLVPPWNRIADPLLPRLSEAGLAGLSTYKPRKRSFAAGGVWQVNTHVDVIDWRGGRRLRELSDIYQQIADHLAARRMGLADPLEPTGILTHHQVMEDSAWAFLSNLFALTNSHPAARWCVPNGEK